MTTENTTITKQKIEAETDIVTVSLTRKELRTLNVLRVLHTGKLLRKMGDGIKLAVLTAQNVGQKASVTLKLEFAPKKGNTRSEQINVFADIDTKLPRYKEDGSIFFATDDGHLDRSNVNQRERPFASTQTADPNATAA